jgi:hypothetical protein
MGTVNKKGHKKLPPVPVALNELEIENFGLEELEFEEKEEEEDDIILDSAEADLKANAKANSIEETVQKVYKGLRVEDMIKVTAKNKFFNEDGIVRRLKDGKVLIKFYTYGTMYEEWLDPDDVRKLSSVEILTGLTGASQPVTQQDIDGPQQQQGRGRDDRQGDMRRGVSGGMDGGPRDRRQDRAENRFRQGGAEQGRGKDQENWNWYKENERRNQGGGYSEGDTDIRGSGDSKQQSGRQSNNKWAQGDVDSQWGRTSQRENRREKRQKPDSSSGDDWSAFVSPASSPPSQAETDDFFASLMTDLSKDLESDKSSQRRSGGSVESSGGASSEDDFFASLMSEISEDESGGSSQTKPASSDNDDFFASLEEDMKGSKNPKQKSAPKPVSAGDDLDDFFSELGAFDKPDAPASANGDGADDFFAGLEAELESELSSKPQASKESSGDDDLMDGVFEGKSETEAVVETREAPKKSSPKTSEAPLSSSGNPPDLQKCTVPVLKEMLKERGLKVSGKKAELVERLRS